MNNNIYYPIKFMRNKCKNGIICIKVLRADTFEVFDLYTNNIGDMQSKSNFIFSNLRYNTDNKQLNDNTKVIVYEDKEKELYGVITYSTHAQLWWIPKENIGNIAKSLDTLLNYNVNITEGTYFQVDSSFNKCYKSSEKIVYRLSELKCKADFSLSIENFDKLLSDIRGNSMVKEEINMLDKTENSNESKDISNNKEQNSFNINDESIKQIINNLVERELKLKEQTEMLLAKEEELLYREREIREREVNFIKQQAFTPEIEMVDTELVVDNMLDMENSQQSVEKSTYELILKTMRKGDCITIPFEVYKKFKIFPRGMALDRNNDYTVFTQIAILKYDNIDTRGLTVMIEVDHENPVIVTILNEYGTQPNNNDIFNEYSEAYRRMKRNRSFMV